MDALEYRTYWDIRFSRQPQLAKIKESLEKIVEAKKSCRALNTLAELNHASAGTDPESKEFSSPEAKEGAIKARDLAAKYYLMSAEQDDIIGLHWLGVFYHEGYGLTKNIPKAIEYL
jgi:TPR repeat protein